jgi:transposase InsO family protein
METLVRTSRPADNSAAPTKRLLRWARRQRRGERHQAIRRRAVVVVAQLVQCGHTWRRTAQQLRITSRTLRRWCHSSATRLVGRPAPPSPRPLRNAVIGYLKELGPGTTLATLRAVFPTMPRAELHDLRRRYRRVWRRRHRQLQHVLQWTIPGAVWAIDFAAAPQRIDGREHYLLAVRDLASGRQLLWQPVAAPTAAGAIAALSRLFARHGPPLVLKCDNGSAFIANEFQMLLQRWGVTPLYSPPGTPSYNGAIEAGIHSLKDRTTTHAARHGRSDAWTYDDVSAARIEANATARPRGPNGPTPDEIWATRTSIAPNLRVSFGQCVATERCVARAELDAEPNPSSEHWHRHVDRIAIRRACVQLGVLLFSRRRIPPPITIPKADRIM